MTSAKIYGQSAFSSGAGRAGPMDRIKRVWDFRRILQLLVGRDLKVKYAGSILGWFWTVLDPLAMSIIFWFIFTKLFTRGVGEEPYIVFLVIGQLLWGWFSGGINGCLKSLRNEAQMVRSSNVPRELWVVRVVVTEGVEFLFSLPVVAIFALLYLKAPTYYLLLLPAVWVMMFFLVAGIGLILAPLGVLVRDLDRVVPIVLRALFYISPVLYSISKITAEHPAFKYIYAYNPLVGPLGLARSAFFPQEFRPYYLYHSLVITAIVFVVGLVVFGRLERSVLKEI